MRKEKPPRDIPKELRDEYTLNNKIKIEYQYANDSRKPDESLIYTKKHIDSYLKHIRKKRTFHYRKTDFWLYQALEKYSIQGKEVAIIGSDTPLYESICLAYGGKPTTIEYNKIISKDARLKVMTVEEYEENRKRFDMAFSISSFEHDGLGRYGDPINPNGDLEAMKKMKYILKPNGILFLAVPIGKDAVVWNVHRIYGRIRLPMLLAEWKVLDTFGYSDDMLDKDYGTKGDLQPIFVLKNEKSKEFLTI